MDFTELFVDVDDFTKGFEVELERYRLVDDRSRRRREGQLSGSEIMTLLIAFQTSNFRDFKHFYLYLLTHHRHDFPDLVSYARFVHLIPRVMMPLFAYLVTRCLGTATGISFIDSTALEGLPPQTHPPPSRVRGAGGDRQDFHGLVPRVQAAPGDQPPRRPAGLRIHHRRRASTDNPSNR